MTNFAEVKPLCGGFQVRYAPCKRSAQNDIFCNRSSYIPVQIVVMTCNMGIYLNSNMIWAPHDDLDPEER